MELIRQFVDVFVHLDVHLNDLAGTLGPGLYVVLFLIVFCETGLVVTPFLPGDSLLFAVGALAATEHSPLRLPLLIVLLIGAAIGGDAVNYFLGYQVGPKVFTSERSRLLNKKHLREAHDFYETYGGLTIVLARFIPIIRTFAPFVAGIGKMDYRKFSAFNIAGGVVWVLSFLLGGYFFSNVPLVKQNFPLVLVAIIIISVLPAGIKFFLARRKTAVAEQVPVQVE